MRSRRVAAFFVALTTFLTLVCVGGNLPASAAAAGCTDANGVSVVVDLRQLGGGILDRCAPGLGAGATGLEALAKAGIPYQGTSQWGDSFICRLLGRPAADESLRIPGNSNYHEKCITTPPATAYWAYWWAPNGGSWHYSGAGASSHRITPGGFEGWVFTLGDSSAQTPPGVAPVRAAPAPAPAANPSQAAQASSPSGNSPSPPASRAAGFSGTAPAAGHAVSSASQGAAAATASSPAHSSAGTGPADTGVSTSITAVGGRNPDHSSGIPTGAIIGACLLAFLLTIGGGTAWRQARARRQS